MIGDKVYKHFKTQKRHDRHIKFFYAGVFIFTISFITSVQGMRIEAEHDFIAERSVAYPKVTTFLERQRIDSVEAIAPQGELWQIVFSKEGVTKFKTYLNAGANPNLVDKNTPSGKKRSLLELYARTGHTEMVKLLLEKGAIVSYANVLQRNVLHDACFEGHDKILSLCIDHLKQSQEKDIRTELINWADVNGFTALHIASDLGHERCVEMLLKAHATPDHMAMHQATALHFASFHGYDSIIRLLLDYGVDPLLRHENGFAARDFYLLGELAQEERRNMEMAQRLEKKSDIAYGIRLKSIEEDASLRMFKSTFQRKCSAIFLAYRALESGALQTTKGDCAIAETIRILDSVIPLPGTRLAFELMAKGVEAYEEHQEKRKKTFLTRMFVRLDEMEEAVEEGAYQLTHLYKEKIKELTPKGAHTLAMCAIAQFLDYMRGNVEMHSTYTLASYILTGVKAPRPLFLENVFPATWLNKRISTKDDTLRWTQRDVFEIADEKLNFSIEAVKDIEPVLVHLATDHVKQSLNIQNALDVADQLQEGRSWRRIVCCCLSHIAKG